MITDYTKSPGQIALFEWKPCPGLSERLFRPIIAQSFARFIIFTDDRTAKSSVNGLAVTLDRLIRLMRHLYIIWSGVDASILNYTEKNDDDEHCNHCIVSIIFLLGALVAGAWTERKKMYHGGSFLKLAYDNV